MATPEVDTHSNEEWIRTGKSIEDTQGPTTKDLRDDIVTEAVYLRGNTYFGNTADLFAAVDAYHAALVKADREGK